MMSLPLLFYAIVTQDVGDGNERAFVRFEHFLFSSIFAHLSLYLVYLTFDTFLSANFSLPGMEMLPHITNLL